MRMVISIHGEDVDLILVIGNNVVDRYVNLLNGVVVNSIDVMAVG